MSSEIMRLIFPMCMCVCMVCLHVNMCLHVWTHICVCVHVYMSVHAYGSYRLTVSVFLDLSLPSILKLGLSLELRAH